MILKGSQRGNGSDLAVHLMNSYDNERVEIAEIHGAVADDLFGAFAEFEAVASGTKASKYLYSLSINPPSPLSREQYGEAMALIEERLGLQGQPRAVVFHIKPDGQGTGREHCHVVWSRIDVDRMKAVHLSHDRSRLMDCAVQLARKFGLELPPGLKAWEEKSRTFEKDKLDPTLAEKAQSQKSGITPDERRDAITQAYEQSDTAEAFRAALSEQGYVLARGDRRAFVVVDEQCDVHSLTRYVKGHKAKDIKAKLAAIDLDDLPDVDAAKELIRERQRNRSQQQGDGDSGQVDDGAMARRREEFARELQRQHDKRRAKLRGQTQELLIRQQQERMALHAAQAKEKSGLFFRTRRAVADLIGKTPALRSILAPLQKMTGLDPLERHKREGEALVRRHQREKRLTERKERFLARIEQREAMAMERKLAALEREDRALTPENSGIDHELSHLETPQRRVFERGNLQVEFNDAGAFQVGEAVDNSGEEEQARSRNQRSRRIADRRGDGIRGRTRRNRGYARDED